MAFLGLVAPGFVYQGVIVLGGSTLRGRLKGESSDSLIGGKWDAVCINADEIVSIRVVYVEKGQRKRRRTKTNPDGSIISEDD
jgi:hypothetical protein